MSLKYEPASEPLQIYVANVSAATQKASGNTFELELDPFLQCVLEMVPGYPGKTYPVSV